ncbi:thioredoxin family protein [Bacteroides gallinaceum]|uniref:Thioredoxin family protein n=1 Tax=Candidatus Phocaeicola excrementipullorum TaxID=2838731 RepID=A0A948TNC2_9BACT|nr:thioredoxin family protein [Bacteroides gallinaceum]MBU3856583.1 thioredoxin family protein [Candidatus Phocaeicola excrementipullorum]MBW9199472.1 hypothetical protein [Bacteroidales bacterium SW299]MDM8206524.1 thioredoxin family protein [Bacteroides gallinaceum]
MVKNVKWFFVVLAISSLISLSFDKKKTLTDELPVGKLAPEVVLCNETKPLNLQSAQGKYTLLSFWASYDAASRVKNAKLNHLAGNDARIKIISISFDRYESVYRAAIEQDGNDAGNCYWEMEGENSDIYKSYGLKNGFTNYLVDNEGVIVAKDVTADMLASLLD